ncbi:histidine kinase dimerization/phosphoacceptor domain -containing protein [Gracilimonas halophila]|uniref:histidine kinase n=1 Tax=Gracilimonas halophila TaxID=1834464 RepID=A0ABW5JK37_9BACT
MDESKVSTITPYGFEVDPIPGMNSFCTNALKVKDLLLIKDLNEHKRLQNIVSDYAGQEIRFFCGLPINSQSGKNIGTICVLDDKPGKMSFEKIDLLRSLAKEVEEKSYHSDLYKRLREKTTFLKHAYDLILKVDIVSFSIMDIQGSVKELTGTSALEIVGKKLNWLISDREFIHAFEALVNEESNSKNQMDTFLSRRTCFLDVRMIKDNDVIFIAARDITSQKRSESGYKKSLKEKQVLLQETHHRVKNNLALISSLLLIEEFNSTNKQVIEILAKSQNRIKSMSLIHEVLYRAKSHVQVPLKQFLEEYIRSIEPRLNIEGKTIKIKSKISADGLNLNQAVPCALIINELVTNAYKHAFESVDQGEIKLGLHIEKEIFYLTVKDNGSGLPENWDIESFETVGSTLIRNLIQQINGKIEYKNESGAFFKVSFAKDYNKGSQSSLTDEEFDKMTN